MTPVEAPELREQARAAFNRVFGTAPLPPLELALAIGAGIVLMLLLEVEKFILSRRDVPRRAALS
jgi:hypothetical protein